MNSLKILENLQVSIPQAVSAVATGVISPEFTGFVLTWVSIPQAVSAVATLVPCLSYITQTVMVSIPQAVSAVATQHNLLLQANLE